MSRKLKPGETPCVSVAATSRAAVPASLNELATSSLGGGAFGNYIGAFC